MGDQWVVGGAEVDEPVPVAEAEEDGHGVECGGEHGGASVGDQIRLPDDPYVAESRKSFGFGDELGELGVLLRRRAEVEVEEVAVPWVVDRQEQALKSRDVAGGGGDEVGKGDRVGFRGAAQVVRFVEEGGGFGENQGDDEEWE